MNNKKTIIALLLVAIIGIVGLTVAYFTNSTSIDNTFTTKEYGTTYTESFVSPDNWLPGDTTAKTVVATNTGEVDEAVRILVSETWTTDNDGTLNGWIHSDGTKSTHTTQSELETDERVAVLNLANTEDWTKVGNYYYYNYKLAPTESTTSFLESVIFNSKTKLDDTCTETVNNGTRTITCNSSGNDYDNATYTLTLTIETVQYNKYATAWNTGNTVNILNSKPMNMQQFVSNKTNPANTAYSSETKDKMYVFVHGESPNQVTDYRYIGDNPSNYVYFNCDDMSNQSSSTCEVWRILGVFDVDDGTGNVEQRMKLVRGNAFSTRMAWNENNQNDWTDTNASLKNFLNGDYYNRSGDAATYGLKTSAKNLIDDAKYYLGSSNTYGSAEQVYAWERGDTLCGACNSDTTKLTWTGMVGLMYPSDEFMAYGSGVNATCYSNPNGCSGTDAQTGWVYNSNKLEGQTIPYYTWFLSPYFSGMDRVLGTNSSGVLYCYSVDDEDFAIRPVVYLKSSVEIDSGTGTELDPYKLKN